MRLVLYPVALCFVAFLYCAPLLAAPCVGLIYVNRHPFRDLTSRLRKFAVWGIMSLLTWFTVAYVGLLQEGVLLSNDGSGSIIPILFVLLTRKVHFVVDMGVLMSFAGFLFSVYRARSVGSSPWMYLIPWWPLALYVTGEQCVAGAVFGMTVAISFGFQGDITDGIGSYGSIVMAGPFVIAFVDFVRISTLPIHNVIFEKVMDHPEWVIVAVCALICRQSTKTFVCMSTCLSLYTNTDEWATVWNIVMTYDSQEMRMCVISLLTLATLRLVLPVFMDRLDSVWFSDPFSIGEDYMQIRIVLLGSAVVHFLDSARAAVPVELLPNWVLWIALCDTYLLLMKRAIRTINPYSRKMTLSLCILGVLNVFCAYTYVLTTIQFGIPMSIKLFTVMLSFLITVRVVVACVVILRTADDLERDENIQHGVRMNETTHACMLRAVTFAFLLYRVIAHRYNSNIRGTTCTDWIAAGTIPWFAVKLISCGMECKDYLKKRRNDITHTFPHPTPEQLLSNDDVCTVCLDDLDLNARVLTCGHICHTPCIRRWFRERMTCPTCNMSFAPAIQEDGLVVDPVDPAAPVMLEIVANNAQDMGVWAEMPPANNPQEVYHPHVE